MESLTTLFDGQFPVEIFPALLTAALVGVILFDISRYIIPNMLNLAIFVLYVWAAYVLDLPWIMALMAAGIVLVIGLGMFALGLMGGGDIKLLVVLTLWTGWGTQTLQFIMLTAIAGGVLVVIVLLLRFFLPPFFSKLSPGRNVPRLLQRKQPVPYGIAIAAAFLFMMSMGAVPGLPA